MADPISKLQNDFRRASARLKSDRAVRFVGTIWHFLALLQHFFEHSYTCEQPPFNQFEFHTKKSASRPDAAVGLTTERGLDDEMRSTRNSQMRKK
jgi:hypothetical protein